jgi:hypothetical protein
MIRERCTSLHHRQTVTRFYFQCTMRTKILILETSLKTQEFPCIRSRAHGMLHPPHCIVLIPVHAYSDGLALNKLGRVDGKLCWLHCQAQPGTDIRACGHKQVLQPTVVQQVPPHLQQNTQICIHVHMRNSMRQSPSRHASSHLATQETVCFSKTSEQRQHKTKYHYINTDLKPLAAYYFSSFF